MRPKIAMVRSLFNRPITDRLLHGAQAQIRAHNIPLESVPIINVPGAVEIPFAIQQLLEKNCFQAIIALGAVIRGETTHYDYVCRQVSDGCQRLMLDYQTPVIFSVLTTENSEQALARSGGNHSNKGAEAVVCALSMIAIADEIANMGP